MADSLAEITKLTSRLRPYYEIMSTSTNPKDFTEARKLLQEIKNICMSERRLLAESAKKRREEKKLLRSKQVKPKKDEVDDLPMEKPKLLRSVGRGVRFSKKQLAESLKQEFYEENKDDELPED